MKRELAVGLVVCIAAVQKGEPVGAQATGVEVVAPGVISTAEVEHNAALTPDGKALYFTRNTAAWGVGGGRSSILVSHLVGGAWTEPEVAPFSGEFDDSDAFVTPDGRRVFFVSTRPGPPGAGGGRDVWVVSLDGAEHTPQFVGGGVNTPGDEYSPVITASGRLYFASTRAGGMGQGDLYVSDPLPGDSDPAFGPAENLGGAVNGPFGEWNLVVSPDESFMVFEASGRALNRSGSGDLYVSFREGGEWTAAVPAESLNTTGSDLQPRLSPDGSQLYFSSSLRAGSDHTDVFVTDVAPVLEAARRASPALLVAVSRSDHHVAVVDPQTLQIVQRFETAPGPHEVTTLADRRVAVAEYGNFPNPHDGPIDSHPGFAPEHPTGNTLRVIDLKDGSARSITLGACARAHGIHSSEDGATVWVTCEQEAAVVEVDVATGRVVQRWSTEAVGSHRVVSTHDDRYLTVANVEAGSVTVIDRPAGRTTVLETGAGSEGMAVSAEGAVWVLASGSGELVEVDPVSATMGRRLRTGGDFPISVSLDDSRGHAWVARLGSRTVDVLALTDGQVVAQIPFDTGPLRVLVVPGSRHAYVSLPRENAVAVVDVATHREIARVTGIMEVDGLAWVSASRAPLH